MASPRRVFLGLGANLGRRAANIRRAIRALSRCGQVIDTSSLVESPAWAPDPALAASQPAYLNAAVVLRTTLSPTELLAHAKDIERELGRDDRVRYSPRPVDVDILLFDDGTVLDEDGGATGRPLAVPHARMAERSFVLEPLAEIAPDLVHPRLQKSMEVLAREARGTAPRLPRVLAARSYPGSGSGDDDHVETTWLWGAQSRVMGVLNVTPDSFSDGGDHASVDAARWAAAAMASAGAHVLDIGGASSRPGAAEVAAEVEAARVVPVIEALRADGLSLPISVDTTSHLVAVEALKAGADWINDISAGRLEPRMPQLAATAGAPLVLMHMRGTPETMQRMATYADVEGEVCGELGAAVEAAVAAGVPRFDLVADPGLGFAKSAEHNWELLRALPRLVDRLRLPLLLGASRKSFLGKLLDLPVAKDRDWATAAVTACAVPHVDIHRVHHVEAMVHVLRAADHLRRGSEALRGA